MSKGSDNDFLKTLKEGVRSVLENKEAKPAEKIAALAAGAKILMVEHKITPEPGDTDGNFFSSKRRKRNAS